MSLLDNPVIQVAQRKILEIRVPFHLLGVAKDEPLRFQLAVASKSMPGDIIPAEGWIELTSGSSTY